MDQNDFNAILLTIKLAVVTTVLLMVFGAPLAWWLSRTSSRLKIVIEPLISLPLILPPTVLGFYLLLFLGAQGPLSRLGLGVWAFSFPGLVVGSLIYSLPFVVQPIQNSFSAIPKGTLEAATTLRASSLDRFFTIAIPLARPGLITGAILGFAHTIGEFGVVLMIGGNIPGKTQVLSIAIYDHVEALEYGAAHWLAGGLVLFSFVMMGIVYYLTRRIRIIR